jgi:t-SNARE complex subunit (syntaxin)
MGDVIKREDVIKAVEAWAEEYKEQHPQAKRISMSVNDVVELVNKVETVKIEKEVVVEKTAKKTVDNSFCSEAYL